MTDKEVDVLINHIIKCDYGYICEYMVCNSNDFCEENCEKCISLSKNCVREYARIKAEEQTNECS